jgi:hypothetical protein
VKGGTNRLHITAAREQMKVVWENLQKAGYDVEVFRFGNLLEITQGRGDCLRLSRVPSRDAYPGDTPVPAPRYRTAREPRYEAPWNGGWLYFPVSSHE